MADSELFEIDGFKLGTGLMLPTVQSSAVMSSVPTMKTADFWDDDQIRTALVVNGMSRHIADRQKHGKRMRNQGSVGSCCPTANGSGAEQAREEQGAPVFATAPCFTYIDINGGRDSGATLPAAFASTATLGLAPAIVSVNGVKQIYPQQVFRRSQVNPAVHAAAAAAAKNFRGMRLLRIPTYSFEDFSRALATGLAKGWGAVWAWHVADIGMRLSNGYMRLARGPGNHANLLHSAKWVGGKTLVHPDNQNSWGPTRDKLFGPPGPSWGELGFGLCTMENAYSCAHVHPPYFIVSMAADSFDASQFLKL